MAYLTIHLRIELDVGHEQQQLWSKWKGKCLRCMVCRWWTNPFLVKGLLSPACSLHSQASLSSPFLDRLSLLDIKLIVEESYKIYSYLYFEQNLTFFIVFHCSLNGTWNSRHKLALKNINTPTKPIRTLFSFKVKNLYRRLVQIWLKNYNTLMHFLIIRNNCCYVNITQVVQIYTCI